MNLLPGWQDFNYHVYLNLVTGILVVLGIAILAMRLFPRTRLVAGKIWKTYIPWFVMVPVIFLTVGSTHAVFVTALLLLSIVCITEFTKATGIYHDWQFILLIYVIVGVTYFFAYTMNYESFTDVPLFAIAALMILPVFIKRYESMLQRVALSCVCVLYLGWFPAHLSFFGDNPARFGYLLFLIIGTELNDAAAYLSGSLFGKHKLIPAISPNKTVEGLLGSLVFTSIYVVYTSAYFESFSPYLAVLSILLIWAGGTIGDLVISYIKRDVGVKDMGKLIPGHGGLLDRADSLILVAPIYFYLMIYFAKV